LELTFEGRYNEGAELERQLPCGFRAISTQPRAAKHYYPLAVV
jgi:hypothetical protein